MSRSSRISCCRAPSSRFSRTRCSPQASLFDAPEELLATKLRALYQRRKGRDLFDLGVAFDRLPDLDPDKVIDCFRMYMDRDGLGVSRAEFEANLAQKLGDKAFGEDIYSLLALRGDGHPQSFEPAHVGAQIQKLLIERLPGDPWKGND